MHIIRIKTELSLATLKPVLKGADNRMPARDLAARVSASRLTYGRHIYPIYALDVQATSVDFCDTQSQNLWDLTLWESPRRCIVG